MLQCKYYCNELATRLPIRFANFLIVTLIQNNISIEQSLIFVFFLLVREKVLLLNHMTNPKYTALCFRMKTGFSE